MNKRGKKILASIVVIFFILATFITFIYHPECDSEECWKSKLRECSRASYVNNPVDVTWEYKIKGEKSGSCEVVVEALSVKQGLRQVQILEGKKMTCLLPLGSENNPETIPNFCSGPLKEAMQELIIVNLHQYIIENVGAIDEKLFEIE